MRSSTLLGVIAVVLHMAASAAWSLDRSVSELRVPLDDWTLIPTLHGSQVESIVGLRDPATVVGSNITTLWFVRTGSRAWKALAWYEQDVIAALAHVKATLGLGDESDAAWMVPGMQGGLDGALGTEPDPFATGVFETDPFLPVIESAPDSGGLIDLLTSSGWAAAKIAIQTGGPFCTQEDILSTIAAMVEADLATGAGGALLAQFTPSSATCRTWFSVRVPMRPDGTWTVPEILPDLPPSIACAAPGQMWQSTAPGTVLSGVQSVVIDVGRTDGAGQPEACGHFVIALVDRRCPDVEVALLPSVPFSVHDGGVPWVTAPASVTVQVSAEDAGDPSPDVVISHNGTPIESGAVITEAGVHVLRVIATDASGNACEETAIFQIRGRDLHGAVAIVESIDPVWNDGMLERLDTVILVASHAFDAWGIHLGSTHLLVMDHEGRFVAGPTPIVGIDPCGGGGGDPEIHWTYQGAAIGAAFQHGYWRLSWSVDLSGAGLSALPAAFMVSGRSASTRATASFDFIARTSAQAPPDAVAALAALGLVDIEIDPKPTPDPDDPEGDPPLVCEWKYELASWSAASCHLTDQAASDCGFLLSFRQYAYVRIRDTVGKPRGISEARDEGCPGAASVSCSLAASGRLRMWLEPAPPCTECEMRVRAWPRFDLLVEVNTPATAVAGAGIAVVGGGLDVSATGAIAVGDAPPASVMLGSDWTIPVVVGAHDRYMRTFSSLYAQEAISDGCAVDVEIRSGGALSVHADGWNFPIGDPFGLATATIQRSTPDIRIIGVVTEGPCEGLSRTERYE